MCWKMVKSLAKQIIYGIILNILFSMVMWCYFATMCTDHDSVPPYYKPPFRLREEIRLAESEEQRNDIIVSYLSSRNINVQTTNVRGYIRYCHYCKHIKPDRTHHCSTCGTCILKMDHHCPWVAACVGHSNYKKFILFLLYTALYLLYAFATMVEYCVVFFQTPNKEKDFLTGQVFLGCLLAGIIGSIVLGFFIYHMYLLFINETTLEVMTETTFRDHEDLTFNISPGYNFLQVFGYEICFWLIPVGDPPGNGIFFYTARND